MAALLVPHTRGQGMDVQAMPVTSVLQGSLEGFFPTLFMTGGPDPGSGPYPTLALDLDLLPGNRRVLTWALAALAEAEASFELARHTTARAWEAELARIERVNEQNGVEIFTGNPDWDAAFALSQKQAYSLFMGPEPDLPYPSFVVARHPDLGFSPRGDGSDHPFLWNGQTALDAYWLCTQLLPGAPDLAVGLLLNFLHTQDEAGFIDWKPGLGGQRGRLLAQPVLASLAWRIYQHTEDANYLRSVLPGLQRFAAGWFSNDHDRDGDGFPEWDHAFQTGFEENPTVDCWRINGQGVDITTYEDPALCALLRREFHSLVQISRAAGLEEGIPALQERLAKLDRAAASCWSSRSSSYRCRDRDSHLMSRGQLVCKHRGPGRWTISKVFKKPARLILHIRTQGEAARSLHISLTGKTRAGETVEVVPAQDICWVQRKAFVTTQNVFEELVCLEISGLEAADEVNLRTVDLTQETVLQLLPLWAEIPSSDLVDRLVNNAIFHPDRFGSEFGLPAYSGSAGLGIQGPSRTVHPAWNALVIEGLLAYGRRVEAARLIEALMRGIIHSLRTSHAFCGGHHADHASPVGERHSLHGLAPTGLFLETLGVRIMSPWRILVTENNPFPWPVTVKYRGLSITRDSQQTHIRFPDGQSTVVSEPGTHLVQGER